MRIFSYDLDKTFDEIFIYLSPEEISELIAKLSGLLENPNAHHTHFSEIDETSILREITVAIITNDNLNEFDKRSKEVILNNK